MYICMQLSSEYSKRKKYLLEDELSLLKCEKQLYQEELDHDYGHLLQCHSSRNNSPSLIGPWQILLKEGLTHQPEGNLVTTPL